MDHPSGVTTPHDTKRLHLRRLAEDDAAFILALVNDPAWLRHIGDRNVHSLDDAIGYIRNGPGASYARHGFGLWCVTDKDDGTPIGLCGLLQRDALTDPDIGFAYLPAYRGQGFAAEAAKATLAFARDDLGLARVLAIVHPDNPDSIRLLERLGMTSTGNIVLHAGSAGDRLFRLDFPARRA